MMESNANASWREREFAPAPGTDVCKFDDLLDGHAREVRFGDGRHAFKLLLLRSGEQVWGYVNACPHNGLPLNVEPDKFLLFEHSHIYCTVHYAVFRFEDGYCEDGPCVGHSLTPVPLAVYEGQIRVGGIV